MGQKLMGYTLPAAETASVDSVVHVGPDESVLILLKHCRDMKQQETRLRLITLLLLLSCIGLFVVITGADSRHRRSSASSGEESAVQPSPAFSKQETTCPSDPINTPPGLHIHLKSVGTEESDGLYVKWKVMFGEQYDEDNRAIAIPHGGFYFVYLSFSLRCPCEDGEESFKMFFVELHNLKKGYGKIILTDASDDVACTPERSRNFFVGELFDLSEGDRINVMVSEGYDLITKSSFGAYLT